MSRRPRCRACGGSLALRFAGVLDPRSNARFDVLRCEACGLGHTDPVPDELAPFYDSTYYGRRHGPTDRWCTRRRVRWLLEATGAARGRLLDVGCGEGTFLLEAERLGFEVAGSELGDAARMAKQAGVDVRGSIDEFPPVFSAVTFWHSLEHMRDPASALASAARLLAPQGSLLVAVPDAGGWQAELFRDRWVHLDVPRHLYHFDRPSLERLLAGAGFEVVRVRHIETEYDLFGAIQSAQNLLFRAPNVLYGVATGRPAGPRSVRLTAIALAVLSLPPAMLASLIGAATGRGATLVVSARRAAR